MTKTILQKTKKAPSQLDDIISALKSLQASRGWAIVVDILNDNIKYLEKAILDKIDPVTQRHISDTEDETLRIKRNLNIEVRDTPRSEERHAGTECRYAGSLVH